MRYEYDYEIGEKFDDVFEVYFPEFDFTANIPNEFYEEMEPASRIYKIGKKSLGRQLALHACLDDLSFKISPKTGLMNDKPIIFFDVETTGVNVVEDQIVQIAITKVYVNGTTETKTRYIKPTIPIPAEAAEVHGITNEMVAGCPKFSEIAKSLRSFIDGCDIAGFNSTAFDVPILQEEFIRAGVHDWPAFGTRFIDVMHIYHHFNPRTLEAAYKYYCKKDLEGAHDAGADITATIEVLNSQIAMHEELPSDTQGLHDFCNQGRVDFAGFLERKEDGEVYYRKGKWKGQKVLDQRGYADWMLSKDFPSNTKACLRGILYPAKIEQTKQEAQK